MQNVEDIYPLAPLQQGLLFHSLYAPASGIYCEQMGIIFQPPFDSAAFKAAWQSVIAHHTILRTAFLWEELEEPLQVVQRQVVLPWIELDWRALSPAEQANALETFKRDDLQRGFEFARAPLLRLTLLRLPQDTYHFIWSYHHLLLDGWSIMLLLDEVFALYEGIRQGTPPVLRPPRPYREYVAWLQAQNSQTASTFWQRYLADFTTPTPLIGAQFTQNATRDSFEHIDSQERDGHLSASTTAALQTYTRQHQLTLNTVLQGAWALLLSRYSGESDVVFGHTVSTRPANLAGVESMVGLFINTLPVRVRLPAQAEVTSWLKQLQEAQAEVRQYDYVPLAELQKWSAAPAGKPLFESLLVIENYPRQSATQGQPAQQNAPTYTSWSASERTNYPLTLSVGPRTELLLRISYDPARFNAPTIARMLEHLRVLLEGIVANPHVRLEELSYLTEQELDQALVTWNTTTATFPREACLHTLFETQAEKTPEAIALVHEDHCLTYAELNTRANRVAHTLLTLGVGPEIRVGLCIPRSPELFIGLLACLKAGGAYVPLDPALPHERLRFITTDARIAVLLTRQEILERTFASASPMLSPLDLDQSHILCLDAAFWQATPAPTSPLPHATWPLNLAYVIYTSGSTGTPRGVLVPHQGAVNYSHAFLRRFDLCSTDRVLQFSSISFDAAVEEIFPTWQSGGTLVLAPDLMTASLSLPEFTAFAEQQSLTVLNFPASFWKEWVLQGLSAQLRPPRYLRLVVVGAEKVDVATYRTWLERADRSITWSNTYGPTETTVTATTYVAPCQQKDEITSCVPIGKPVANTQGYVLDPQMRAVAVYVSGELYIGGAGVTRGYLNRPDATAERFVPHPFSSEPGARLYRTGDRVRYLPDGNLEFLGRFDHQVKLRGYRIELNEIEAALRKHPYIQECAVVMHEDPQGEQFLVAYLLPASPEPGESGEKQQAATSALRQELKQSLPAYMLPTTLIWMARFPLTSGGKLDRRALPSPKLALAGIEATLVPPRNSVEEAVAQIWTEVLGLQKVGVHDNFFERGGHSLRATQVISRVREFFQVELPVRSIFDGPTIAELAEAIIMQGIAEADSDDLDAFLAQHHE